MASIHEYKDFDEDVKKVYWSEILTGEILSVDVVAITASVDIVDVGQVDDVPIFYHCEDEETVDNGYIPFGVGLNVLILAEKTSPSDSPDYTVIGFTDQTLKSCKRNLVVRFTPIQYEAGPGCLNKCFVWNIDTNNYMPIPGFPVQDIYDWEEVGPYLASQGSAGSPCYTGFAKYGVNDSIIEDEPWPPWSYNSCQELVPGDLCNPDAGWGDHWAVNKGSGYGNIDYPYTRPDGVVENTKKTIVCEADTVFWEGFMGWWGGGSLWAHYTGSLHSAATNLFPSYKNTISESGSSQFATIQTQAGFDEIACFPLHLESGDKNWGHGASDMTTCDSVVSGVWGAYFEYGKKSKMITPLGTKNLHEKSEGWTQSSWTQTLSGDPVGIGYSHSWRIIEESDTAGGRYEYYLYHTANGFSGNVMYQISIGFCMRTAKKTFESRTYPEGTTKEYEVSFVHDYDVQVIAGCGKYGNAATLHNPKNQERNRDLERAVEFLIKNNVLDRAVVDSVSPGFIETFFVNF